MPTFEVKTPVGANQIVHEEADPRGGGRGDEARQAAAELGGLASPARTPATTSGPGTPIIHFEQWENDDEIEVKLILKGGGCENMNAQYSLPTELPNLGRADRSLDGVRKCILHAVWNAQGKGCAPGAIGVCIGGDRTSGYVARQGAAVPHARRRQSGPAAGGTRSVDHGRGEQARHRHDGLRRHDVSLIGCKIGALNRLPASFFVSVAYDCWAFRRLGVVLDATTRRDQASGSIATRRSSDRHDGRSGRLPADGPRSRAPRRRSPRSRCATLKVGDVVLVSGRAYTGRDAVHHHLMKHEPPVDLRGGGALSLRSGGREGRRRLEGHRRRPDDEHS